MAQVRSKLAYYGAALLALAAAGTLVGTRILHGGSRDRLRLIVQQQCLPDWLLHHNPAPCRTVKLMGGEPDAPGFVVMPDRKGGAHFLLIPTRAIRGIESPGLRAPGALNYYAAAWTARDALADVVGHPVAPNAVGMAVNQRRARSQDQLHIHISCLRRSVYDALQASAARIGSDWSSLQIAGQRYQAMRVMGTGLGAANPFALLAGRSVPGAELLLDSSCAVAR